MPLRFERVYMIDVHALIDLGHLQRERPKYPLCNDLFPQEGRAADPYNDDAKMYRFFLQKLFWRYSIFSTRRLS